jgi:hypothetical protein
MSNNDNNDSFVDMLMRFGMGILLTPEEQERMAPLVKPCYAALGLANDYFSFDIEWEEFQREEDTTTMTNAVWLFMQWEGLGVDDAKRRVREVTNMYDSEYLKNVEEFCAGEGKDNLKLQEYLMAQGHQVPGNVAWSLRCPRYHPWLCREAGELLEGSLSTSEEKEAEEITIADRSGSPSHSESDASEGSPTFWSGSSRSSVRSSVSSTASLHEKQPPTEQTKLGDEVRR